MIIQRSTKVSLKYLTKDKRSQLEEILYEYGNVVNWFIVTFWSNPPNKMKLSKDIINEPETWF